MTGRKSLAELVRAQAWVIHRSGGHPCEPTPAQWRRATRQVKRREGMARPCSSP